MKVWFSIQPAENGETHHGLIIQKKISLSKIVRESINFWEDDICCNDDNDNILLEMGEIFQAEFNENSKQVAVTVATCIVKILDERTTSTDCKLKLIANEKFIERDEYLNWLSGGGIIRPCPSLLDFTFEIFSVLDIILRRFFLTTNRKKFMIMLGKSKSKTLKRQRKKEHENLLALILCD